MLCDNCRAREAKIYYTEIMDGLKKEQHLCEECAKKLTTFQMEAPVLSKQFTLGTLLSTLLNAYEGKEEKQIDDKILVCKNCGMKYQEFLQHGVFGCPQCYESFREPLGACIKNIQGASRHTGKIPKGFQTTTEQIVHSMSEIDRLSIRLQQAIEKEEFEEAAKLRDTIRDLKEKEEMKHE